ncbi:MAG: hypothetical protein JJT76_12810 [Clostridiaceae bacterium]|nr:hypothetical protein [Clostridiaceae bacterium]
MSINETPTWEEEIYLIKTDDRVLGGEEGIANRQAKELANRTNYLKKQSEEHEKKAMPHQLHDADSDKTYRFGLKQEGGHMKFIYEEVEE